MSVNSIKKKVADKYGLALYLAAKEGMVLPEVESNVGSLLEMLKNKDMVFAIQSPSISKEAKIEAFLEISKRAGFNVEVANFLKLLIMNGRIFALEDVLKTFLDIVDDRGDDIRVDMVSAYPVLEAGRTQIKKDLENKFNHSVKLVQIINPRIVGGIQLRIGSLLIDDSIKGKLQRLKNVMKGV